MLLDELKTQEWGLVLAGGGGKGSYQIGVWKELIELGLYDKVTAIAGSSVGALNLILMAYNDYPLANRIWSNIKPSQFLDWDLSMIDFKQGLFKRDGLVELIDNYINLETVSKCNRNLFVTASICNKSGKECNDIEYFKINGKSPTEIKEILLASSAMPYIYEHVNIDGIVYRDGGLQDNLPIKPIYDAGYRNIIIIPLDEIVEIDIAKFPYAHFITIAPSKNLGNLINGTLDFSKENSIERMKLGYKDGLEFAEHYLLKH